MVLPSRRFFTRSICFSTLSWWEIADWDMPSTMAMSDLQARAVPEHLEELRQVQQLLLGRHLLIYQLQSPSVHMEVRILFHRHPLLPFSETHSLKTFRY